MYAIHDLLIYFHVLFGQCHSSLSIIYLLDTYLEISSFPINLHSHKILHLICISICEMWKLFCISESYKRLLQKQIKSKLHKRSLLYFSKRVAEHTIQLEKLRKNSLQNKLFIKHTKPKYFHLTGVYRFELLEKTKIFHKKDVCTKN